jgi:hypothetical protein
MRRVTVRTFVIDFKEVVAQYDLTLMGRNSPKYFYTRGGHRCFHSSKTKSPVNFSIFIQFEV